MSQPGKWLRALTARDFSRQSQVLLYMRTLDGTISLVAGTGVAGYNGDEIPATSAMVSGPSALAYDRSKARGEREITAGLARGLDAVIVNPSGIIGPYDFKPSPLGEVLLKMAQRRLPGLV